MGTEYWVLSIIAIVLALAAGFIGGRMSAPRQRRVEAMEQERDAAREEAEAVRAEVNRHFEESARMFGKLASDYRTFFQQFAQTAQNLGLSEGRARELLEEADPNLVARQAKTGDQAAPATPGTEPEAEPRAESASESTAGEHPDATPTEQPVGERAGADESKPRDETSQAPDGATASGAQERPGTTESDEVPADQDRRT